MPISRSLVRRRWPVVTAIVIVPIAVLVAVYLAFFTPDSPEKLSLTKSAGESGASSGGSAADASDLEGTWRVSSDSQAGYRVREKLAALPASSDAVGRTSAITGSVTLAKSGSGVRMSNATFDADVSQLKSDEARRDNRIRTVGLETDQFPKASFVASAPIDVPGSALNGSAAKLSTTGDLTMHGVTKRLTLPIQAQFINGKIEVVGSYTFPWAEFGMSAPSVGPFVTVESDPTLEFKLVLERAV